ncbi:sporulation peptidase YabG [Paenibacillus mucilaginosus]|uniref:Sporulation peptidase YabG n=3 Tax=Paenibacillus mucilaginosus TaxID=61624 RepID=H6NSH8_9BACL|nr:sporulation peptidase YabG [Paenibacillus mucilaginosus]AEI46100.1 sporulation peptidase YabG [Paenibacillus mucilaginosus KNP414]AFC33728.1 sporulation peptidase YabG [Paenibacillus mucilaginosus 3016]AFH66061.2 sporulation peptidase YabG [Paenibacillus mucilaginosus K02]MCG7217939.1 sporulation peptidase YabG [Paenibacillus mucilaginosus]WDM27438.1 sporulation peptidase YabG [Paenibacillus mucilaginosus]
MRQGDLVTRRSYGGDIVFKIQEIRQQVAVLRGVEMRLLADAPLQDLEAAPQYDPFQYTIPNHPKWMEAMRRTQASQAAAVPGGWPAQASAAPTAAAAAYFELPGKVLHLDGDPNYLRKCMTLYGELRVPAEGYYVAEANMADALYRLLPQVQPDIVVVTGHDGILKQRSPGDISQLSSYKNSHNFVNAVRVARQYEKSRDALTVIAGACQSHFEALLQAGANFASSPGRVLIHALDPLCIAAKVAFTPIRETVNIVDVIGLTHSGLEGLGGVESRGSYRRGVPRIPYLTQK